MSTRWIWTSTALALCSSHSHLEYSLYAFSHIFSICSTLLGAAFSSRFSPAFGIISRIIKGVLHGPEQGIGIITLVFSLFLSGRLTGSLQSTRSLLISFVSCFFLLPLSPLQRYLEALLGREPIDFLCLSLFVLNFLSLAQPCVALFTVFTELGGYYRRRWTCWFSLFMASIWLPALGCWHHGVLCLIFIACFLLTFTVTIYLAIFYLAVAPVIR